MSSDAARESPPGGAPALQRVNVVLALAALYAPMLAGFATPCAHCRGVWLQLFPVLPGCPPVALVLRWLPEAAAYGLAGLVTLATIALTTRLCASGGWRRVCVLALAALYGCLAGNAVYGVIRM